MYQYDLLSQRDLNRLSLEAEALGREAAHSMPLTERSDVVRARASQLCEQALARSAHLTNDPVAYTTSFIEAYTDAYFQEVVALLYKSLRSISQTQPESQSIPP